MVSMQSGIEINIEKAHALLSYYDEETTQATANKLVT